MIKDWNELDLNTYYEIYKVTNNQLMADDDKIFHCAAILNGITYKELMEQSIETTKDMVAGTLFLYTRPVKEKIRKKHIMANGNEYVLTDESAKMTTAQYIDYQSVIVEKYEEHIVDLLSIILVPKGHSYNDGYDMGQVREDLGHLMVTEALGITDFFIRLYRRLLRRTLLYSSAEVTLLRMRAPKEMKKELKVLEKEYSRKVNELLTMCGSLSLEQLLN